MPVAHPGYLSNRYMRRRHEGEKETVFAHTELIWCSLPTTYESQPQPAVAGTNLACSSDRVNLQ